MAGWKDWHRRPLRRRSSRQRHTHGSVPERRSYLQNRRAWSRPMDVRFGFWRKAHRARMHEADQRWLAIALGRAAVKRQEREAEVRLEHARVETERVNREAVQRRRRSRRRGTAVIWACVIGWLVLAWAWRTYVDPEPHRTPAEVRYYESLENIGAE